MVALSDADVATYDGEQASLMYFKLLLSPPGSPVGGDVYPMTVDGTFAPDSAGGGSISIASRRDAALSVLRIVAHIRNPSTLHISAGAAQGVIEAGATAFGPCAFVAGFTDANEQLRHTNATGGWDWDSNWWGGDPNNKGAYTVANYEIVFGMDPTWLQQTIDTGNIMHKGILTLHQQVLNC